MAPLATSTGSLAHPLKDRKNDLYETPPEATIALWNNITLPRVIWEPACGPGAIVGVLRNLGHKVIATDLVDYECPDSIARRDFLLEQKPPDGVKAIVTNPPFKLAAEFGAHALMLGVPKLAMLVRLAFLEAGNRNDMAGRARRFILDENPPATVFVFRNRLPMMHRHGWKGPKAKSSVAFCWIYWDADYEGPTVLKRISWEPLPEDSNHTQLNGSDREE